MIVARVDGKVTVAVEGDANVEVIYIDDGSDDVQLEGTFGSIEIAAPEIVVRAIGATINNVAVAGAGAQIVVDNNSTVGTINIAQGAASAKVEVAGKSNVNHDAGAKHTGLGNRNRNKG